MDNTIDLKTRLPSTITRVVSVEPSTTGGTLPAGLVFTGAIKTGSDYCISGEMHGAINAGYHDVRVTEGAIVKGDISARNVSVEGHVTGPIHCPTGYVNFTGTAVCDVTVRYLEMEIAKGARVNANMQRTVEAIENAD